MSGLSSPATRRFLDERFRAAVGAPYDRATLQPLRDNAPLLREYLMSHDGRATVAQLESSADLNWLHEIYDAISEVAEERESEERPSYGLSEAATPAFSLGEAPAPSWNRGGFGETSETVHPSDREDALVGQAFEELLVDGLPTKLVDVDRFFAEVKPANPRVQAALRATPSLVAAGPVAHRLVRYGITPVLVVNASQAVATAVRRHYRLHRLARDRQVLIDDGCVWNDPKSKGVVRRGPLCEGVRLATELAPTASDRLFDWLIAVAGCKPLLFDRFQAHKANMGLLLEPTAERVDLFTAWKTTASQASSEISNSRAP